MTGEDKIQKLRKKLRGYTLLELSVVLMIIAIVTASGAVMFTSSLKKQQVEHTRGKLEVIQKALLDYRCVYGRLPCPGDLQTTDTAAIGREAANYGACVGGSPTASFNTGEIVAGMVPTRALKLGDEHVFDGWGNRMVYAVDRRLTARSAFSSILPTDTATRITVVGQAGSTITSQAAFVVLSFGPNGHGAHTRAGGATRISANSTNVNELENCDCTQAGASVGYDTTYVDQLPTVSTTSYNTVFDDVLTHHSAYRESCYAGGVPAPVAVNCGTPWGGTVAHGASVTAYLAATVPFGQSCTSQSRTCSNGTLSGSYQFQSCTVNPPAATCNLPWGGTINDGQSVTAYQASSVPFGSTCTSQTRTCTNGTLSGSYQYQNCTVDPAANCSLPWGGTINHGQAVTAYEEATVPYGSSCVSESRSCSNGTLSGTYTIQNCAVDPPADCSLPWGGTLGHGQSVTAYQALTVPFGQSCVSHSRTCTDGSLSGSYQYDSCTVDSPPPILNGAEDFSIGSVGWAPFGGLGPAVSTSEDTRATTAGHLGLGGSPKDYAVRLIKADTISGDNKALAAGLQTTDTVRSYGSSSELWGIGLTPADVNAANFGLAYAVVGNAGSGTISRYMKVTGFGFSIPVGSTITGIGAQIEASYELQTSPSIRVFARVDQMRLTIHYTVAGVPQSVTRP